ncbi:hypothetical protein BD410DRAFT_445425 [Rickenella mellea]|uniref:Uncharacterized protein n=1 Tax=Rickenella mellea TaxID=50990 RepID=A0A4Y7PXQ9_9AGAM|nr:hypothetical protein BD410DRAFT_445425 [Rickenella mellea]
MLSYMRSQEAQAPAWVPIPSPLKSWIKGYPGMLAPLECNRLSEVRNTYNESYVCEKERPFVLHRPVEVEESLLATKSLVRYDASPKIHSIFTTGIAWRVEVITQRPMNSIGYRHHRFASHHHHRVAICLYHTSGTSDDSPDDTVEPSTTARR